MSVLFLSHSGIDTDGARAVKRRLLEAAPDWRVWFDKDDLEPGRPWLPQIEQAIARAHAFVVYVGSAGIINFVDAEVQVALGRAITEPGFRFIPLLSEVAPPPEALPAFARQFQAVRLDDFERLLAVLHGNDSDGRLQPETNPFFALAAISESRSHLFFGREEETRELVQRVFERPLVLVSGDSGSGKSSLVRAGLVPKFRGGALSVLKNGHPDDRLFHVIVMSPRDRPWRELGDAVLEAARPLRLSVEDRNALAMQAASRDLEQARRALRCDLPADSTSVLLVVDQFEELFTTTPQPDRESFVKFLVELANSRDERFRVVLTMRHDYVNLCSSLDDLRQILDVDDRRARFALRGMREAELRRVITEPLRLAGVPEKDRDLLARQILAEVGRRPGDLALVQMALTETWAARVEHAGDLMAAYASVGRVEGALAVAAEKVRTVVLQRPESRELAAALDSVLIRLVRLGDTGGATRRLATRGEFDDRRWKLIQLLADEEGKRLALISGSAEQPTAEIAHEALVTAWSHLQNLLQSVAADKRILDALIPKAMLWRGADLKSRRAHLTSGMELQQFQSITANRSAWLSATEVAFITASQEEVERQRRSIRTVWRTAGVAVAVIVVLLTIVSWQFVQARRALQAANSAAASSLWNRLDFVSPPPGSDITADELTALWEVRRATTEVRAAFLDELVSKSDRLERFGRQPQLVARALFADWPRAEAARALDAVITQLTSAHSKSDPFLMNNAATVLALKVAPEEVTRAFDELVRALKRGNGRNEFFLHTALAGIADALRDGEVDARFAAALRESNPDVSLIRGLADNLSPNVADALLRDLFGFNPSSVTIRTTLLDVAPELVTRINEAQAITRLTELTGVLRGSTGDARGVLGPNLDRLAGALAMKAPLGAADELFEAVLSNGEVSWTLMEVLAAIGRRTTARPITNATAVLREVLAGTGSFAKDTRTALTEGLISKVPDKDLEETLAFVVARIKADNGTENDERAAFLLAQRLPQARFDRGVQPLIEALGSARTEEQRVAIAGILGGLIGRLSDGHVALSFATVLDWFERESDPVARSRLQEPLEVLGDRVRIGPRDFSRLSGAKSEWGGFAVYASVLSRVPNMTPEQMSAVAESIRTNGHQTVPSDASTVRMAMERIYARLGPPHVQTAVDRILREVGKPKDPRSLPVAEELLALAPSLTPLQARQLLRVFVKEITEQTFGPELSDALVAVANNVDEAGAREGFDSLIDPSVGHEEEDEEDAAVAKIAAVLALKLGSPEASMVFPMAIKILGGGTPGVFSGSLEDLARKIGPESRTTAIEEAQVLLAWSNSSAQRETAAKALVVLWTAADIETFVRSVVEALNYPTAIDTATTVLLDALKTRLPKGPGSQAGLEANIAWLKANYPAVAPLVHPDRLPPCPTPRWSGLSCPGADR